MTERKEIIQHHVHRTELQYGLEERQRAINQAVWDMMHLSPPGHVLDICTGTSGSSPFAARDGLAFTGIDIAFSMLNAHRFPDRVIQADAARLPFPNDSFTGITMIMAMNNIMGNDLVSREIARVLKPGGKIAIADAGPNMRLIKCMLFGLEETQEIVSLNPKDYKKIEMFYEKLGNITPAEYTWTTLSLMFGITPEEFAEYARSIQATTTQTDKEKGRTSPVRLSDSIITNLYEHMTRMYFAYIEQTIEASGLVPVAKGGLLSFQDKEREWHTGEPVQVEDPTSKLNVIYEAMTKGWIDTIPSSKACQMPVKKYIPIGVYMKP